jgi:hypothetical protein
MRELSYSGLHLTKFPQQTKKINGPEQEIAEKIDANRARKLITFPHSQHLYAYIL